MTRSTTGFGRVSKLQAGAALLAAVVSAALVLVETAPAGAVTDASCAASHDPYALSADTLTACGFATFPLQSAVTSSSGSTDYTYMIDGYKTVYWASPG